MPVTDFTVVRITTCQSEHKDDDPNLDIQPMEVASSNLDPDNQAQEKELARIDRQKKARRCPFPGIDMEYIESEMGLTDLHFTIKYKKMKGNAEPVKAHLRKPRQTVDELEVPAIVTEESTEDEAPSYQHLVNQRIVYQNDLYVINSVSEDGATVEMMRYIEQDRPTSISVEAATHILQTAIRRQ